LNGGEERDEEEEEEEREGRNMVPHWRSVKEDEGSITWHE